MDKFIQNYFDEVKKISSQIDIFEIKKIINFLKKLKKKKGRLFFLGVGGGAGNASHAVNDFRKILEIESYSPIDNVSELTARINDDGWKNSYKDWLIASNISRKDALFIFSVGGGSINKKISLNLVESIKLAKKKGSVIIGITGPDGGYTKKNADYCIRVPISNKNCITVMSESFQAIIWHLLVSYPTLKKKNMKWETILK